jgi:hypothetical protein
MREDGDEMRRVSAARRRWLERNLPTARRRTRTHTRSPHGQLTSVANTLNAQDIENLAHSQQMRLHLLKPLSSTPFRKSSRLVLVSCRCQTIESEDTHHV